MYELAKQRLIEFIKTNFKMEDAKVRHKLKHTFYVVDNAEYICNGLKLDEKNKELAMLIALFHDFGRFYEARDFKSFREDLHNMDHATLGAELLFKENLITNFIDDYEFFDVMKVAIANHSKYILDETNMSETEILHCKIIRDADKLDSFRAKSVEDIYTMSNITEDEIETSIVSENIYNDFMNEKTILSKDRKTGLDIWVSYIAFIFGLYFDISKKFILEKNYINILIDRFNYKKDIAKQQMENIRNKANYYLGK